jgi:hypothetical protein
VRAWTFRIVRSAAGGFDIERRPIHCKQSPDEGWYPYPGGNCLTYLGARFKVWWVRHRSNDVVWSE